MNNFLPLHKKEDKELNFAHIVHDVKREMGWKSESKVCGEAIERWVQEYLCCPHCFRKNEKKRNKHKFAKTLSKCGQCTKAIDFSCKVCGNGIQVKSKRGTFFTRKGKMKQISSGEYFTTLSNLFDNPPYFYLIEYTKEYKISSVFFVDKKDVNDDFICKRNPLSPKARRPGWVGCFFRFPVDVVKCFHKPTQLKFGFMNV